MKTVFAFVVMSTVALSSYAQKDASEYKKRADEVRQEVWDNATSEFKVKTIPAELSNESAVIIARQFENNDFIYKIR